MFKGFLTFVVAMATAGMAFGQIDSTTQPSPVKTLTLKQYTDYKKGLDLHDMALPATMNGYPLPDDVLALKKELKLSTQQVSRLTAISKYLQLKKTEIGQSVLLNEKKLDDLFRTGKINEGSITFYGNRYGLYEGEYRTSVLQACYDTYKTLYASQLEQLKKLKKP